MGDHQDDDDRQQSNGQYLTDHPPDDGNRSVKSSARPRRFDYATHISDIRQATTIKHNQVFLLTDDAGDILPQYLGYGMYFRDMCYLDHLELRLQGKRCVSLLADASAGSQAVYELTNPSLELSNGHTLSKERLSVRRVIALREYLTQTITIRNLDQAPVELAVELRYGSHFTDIFTIRGAKQGKRGTLHVPKSHHDEVVLGYSGADGHKRTTTLRFSPTPADVSGKQAQYHLRLKPGEAATLTMTYELQDDGQQADAPSVGTCTEKTGTGKHASFCRVLAQTPQVDTGNVLFNRALARSLTDLQMLATANVDDLYVAAGIPWYVALFGRDSCITAFETLAYHPALAKNTLRLLARHQGTKYDRFQDEEPGKILHELRTGERANLREVPMIPYYGTVDATPWFLMLLAEYIRWTGDLDLFRELGDNIDGALRWMDSNESDANNIPGYLTYGSRSESGLLNQGWKDSDNGIVNPDGSICEPPIALVEVQSYAYYARRALASVYAAAGNRNHADALNAQATDLDKRFNEDYWVDSDTGYALCLQRDRRQSGVVSSNAGQTLFTGIVPRERVQTVVSRLMRADMFCGWGVRTLSAREKAYNPLDYQIGSVWPHDNALIALGMRRQGFTHPMEAIFSGIFEAATHFPEFRLPEVFDGLSDDQYARPVHHPIACSPQAWAAGALPMLLQRCPWL